ncbi:hypothetical protein E3N88_13761 [Mikania micrantha]|uniref:Uncharacterized protein n=1 Tax=Mikania micrantha TaxID=192012 RepID=A0A5N6P173_9ASTR|nr:hypothetical protein E3N88_13761 [Mikania micrantha]
MRDKAFNALNKQVGQMAEDLAKRNPGTLPSDTKVNPAHQGSSSKHAQVKQVTTLRSGKVYDKKVDAPPTFVEGVVEDVDEDEESDSEETPIASNKQPDVILGRPFFATAHAKINCVDGTVHMTFGNRKLRMNMFSPVTNFSTHDTCFMADIIDSCVPCYDPVVSKDNTVEVFSMFDRLEKEHMQELMDAEKEVEVKATQELSSREDSRFLE